MATDTIDFKMRAVYNFDVYPSAKLGTNFKNVTVTGILSEQNARRYINTVEMHAYVYPDLPQPGTPNDPTAYDYVQLKMQNGQETVLGIAWIKPDSVVLVDSGTATVKVNNVTATDMPRLRNCLLAGGFTSVTIDFAGGTVSS